MNQNKKRDSDVNGTQDFGLVVTSGRSHATEQCRPGCHQVTAKGK